MKTFQELLIELNSCNEAKIWAKDKTIKEVVETCHRGDWLLWLAFKIQIDERALTLAKGHCANTVRHLMSDERSKNAVDAAIAYGNGLIQKDELKLARSAAWSAASAASSAAAAASAAFAYSAAFAASIAVSYAADAAGTWGGVDAKKENQMQTANICREHIGGLIIEKVNELLNEQKGGSEILITNQN